MRTSPTPSAVVAKVEWVTALGDTAQKLLNAHNARYDAVSVKDFADELTVGEVRDVFKEMDAEFLRLEQFKQALISTKNQLQDAIHG